MAKVLLTAEVLPARVLGPGGDDFFVADIANVLEQLQTHHQADGVAGAANACCVQAAKLPLAGSPVDLASQDTQCVALVYQVDQLLAKQVYFSFVGDFS